MSQSTAASTYDEIAFPDQPLPLSQPDRLSAVAALFGMQTAAVDGCRVLELGCAAGSNLLPMAERHPEATFVGIDFSQRQIAAARQTAAALRLENVEFRQMNIAEIDAELGTFDYIICHGVYSRVSPDVQQKVLAVCSANLRPQGVAFISYNIYPGWHQERTIRFLIGESVAAGGSPGQRLAKAQQVLDLFSEILQDDPSPHGRLLKERMDVLLAKPLGYLFHDHMEAENHPLYFHEFVERAAAYDLEYLADARPGTMFVSAFGPLVEEAMQRIAGDLVSVEQHLDVLRNRGFRESLWCRRGNPLVRQIRAASAYGLRFSGNAPPEDPQADVTSSEPQNFRTTVGEPVALTAPETKAALVALAQIWPHSVSFDELAAAAAARLGRGEAGLQPDERDLLGRELLYLTLGGVLDIQTSADRFVTSISRCPTASGFARWQAAHSLQVTNRRHEQVQLDEVVRNILLQLDGSNDRQMLMAVLHGAVQRGEITILKNSLPAGRGEFLSDVLESILDRALAVCAAHALLVA